MLPSLSAGGVNLHKLKIDRLIIVEGRYDKIRLSNIVDADIIAVNGFSVFKDDNMKKTLKKLALEKGVIILTDSDTAGYKIRVFVSQILSGCDVVHILAPQISGKEKRKATPSAQGYVGIEGMDDDILIKLLSDYVSDKDITSDILPSDLYQLGFMGCDGAKEKKNKLLLSLGVQQNISNKFLLRLLNEKYTKEEFYNCFGGKI